MASSLSNAISVLREATRIPARNQKLTIQVMLLLSCPSFLLMLLHYSLAGPLLGKVEDGYEQSRLDPGDVRALALLESFFLLAFSLVSFSGMMLVINGSTFPHTTRPVSLKHLISRIRSRWKKPFLTWLCVSVLTAAYVVMLCFFILFASYIRAFAGNLASVIGVVATVAVTLLLYFYLAPKWALGLVVSVVEDDWQGMKALSARAQELIRGKKTEGFILVLVLALLSVPIYVLFYVTVTDDEDHLVLMVKIGFGFCITILLCLVNSFSCAVFTVFYYVCSQRLGEKLEVELELGHGYDSVPSNLQVELSGP
ncbi:uncharacterized protein LOC125313943 [Rhodamnia argentea]|uniref:Uncharacterized protein LOC125313943 n=1 Tax=Rhodamnia argentea TaxID=178133 RepID=A0ABM3H3T7_9MYRT|nr:uncharacterized protein LOC125313943 [Rhodamnia argentea]